MRMVKCIDTGNSIPIDQAFKVTNKGKNKYYETEDGYNKILKETDYLKRCNELFWQFMGYSSTEKVPTIYFHKLQDWHKGYSYETIYKAMTLSVAAINWARCNREFEDELRRSQYYCAIIQNRLGDAKKDVERTVRQSAITYDIDDINISNDSNSKHVNISRFLEA